MQIFNVGIMEMGFILVIVLLVFNPKDISKNVKTVLKTVRSVKKSEVWEEFSSTSKEIMAYPQKLKEMIESDLSDEPEAVSDEKKTSDRIKQVPPKLTQLTQEVE